MDKFVPRRWMFISGGCLGCSAPFALIAFYRLVVFVGEITGKYSSDYFVEFFMLDRMGTSATILLAAGCLVSGVFLLPALIEFLMQELRP